MNLEHAPLDAERPELLRAQTAFDPTQNGDDRWFYPALGHRDAISRLQLLGTPGTLVVITGEPGAGKSLLIAAAMRSLPLHVAPVMAGEPADTSTDVRLLKSLLSAAGKAPQGRTGLELTSELLQWTSELAREGRMAAFIIDDAHRRSSSQLEIVRTLISNASGHAPLSLVLLGEPDLIDKLQRKQRLLGRISLHYSLNPLSDIDGVALIEHRLAATGCDPGQIFSAADRLDLVRRSGGNPGDLVRLARASIEHMISEPAGKAQSASPGNFAGMSRGIPASESDGSALH